MLVYKLKCKVENRFVGIYRRIVSGTEPECKLIIDNTYFIERYIHKDYLLYFHIKEDKLIKVCIYKKETEE